mmetsp:Transcript_1989/g.5742  ORF Transcript_1989/g.5742 Transcript_1989/m.5742 type:complete len:271 (+) Transcript_1989:307-1119(+)
MWRPGGPDVPRRGEKLQHAEGFRLHHVPGLRTHLRKGRLRIEQGARQRRPQPRDAGPVSSDQHREGACGHQGSGHQCCRPSIAVSGNAMADAAAVHGRLRYLPAPAVGRAAAAVRRPLGRGPRAAAAAAGAAAAEGAGRQGGLLRDAEEYQVRGRLGPHRQRGHAEVVRQGHLRDAEKPSVGLRAAGGGGVLQRGAGSKGAARSQPERVRGARGGQGVRRHCEELQRVQGLGLHRVKRGEHAFHDRRFLAQEGYAGRSDPEARQHVPVYH